MNQQGVWLPTRMRRAEDLAVILARSHAPDPVERATTALELSIGRTCTPGDAAQAVDRLTGMLDDPDADVRHAAASSLGRWRDPGPLERILARLEQEAGDAVSSFAFAAAMVALEHPDPRPLSRALDALDRFAAKGDVASRQVAEFAWWLDGSDPPASEWDPDPDAWSERVELQIGTYEDEDGPLYVAYSVDADGGIEVNTLASTDRWPMEAITRSSGTRPAAHQARSRHARADLPDSVDMLELDDRMRTTIAADLALRIRPQPHDVPGSGETRE